MKLQQNIARATLTLAVLTCGATAHAQTLVRSVNGPAVNAKYGKVCITIADQNSDGYKDVLVGAPGFNQDRGAIYCVSGVFLATGTGTQTLWTCAPTVNAGDRFGTAMVAVDDETGDGVRDFLVGQPGYDTATATDCGAVRLVSGSSHAALSLISGTGQGAVMGTAIAAIGNIDFDGRTDVVVGSPGTGMLISRISLLSSTTLAVSGSASSMALTEIIDYSNAELGTSLSAGFDYVNTGGFATSRFVAGAPGFDSPGLNAGKADIVTLLFTGSATYHVQSYYSSTPGERLGTSVDAVHDYDGDGAIDYIVGAPNFPNGSSFEVGRTVVLSGARVLAQTAPYEIHAFAYGSVVAPVNHADPEPSFHFGAAVRACADLNNDGVGEIVIGAPDYFTQGLTSGWNFRGLVRIFSGATGSQLSNITGASTDRLGDGLAGAVDDLDGDGFKEFVVAGSRSDAGGTDSGVLKCYRLFPVGPSTYCTGKVNSLGCTPAIAFSGVPSANSSAAFSITASNVINQKTGLLFYSHNATTTAFQGGFKCAADPVRRTGAFNSGGSASGSSCTGTYSLDFNARIAIGVDPSLVAGAEIYAQWWSRDPNSASHTSLSNALRFLIHP